VPKRKRKYRRALRPKVIQITAGHLDFVEALAVMGILGLDLLWFTLTLVGVMSK